MAVGTATIGMTPQHGVIERTWEYDPATGRHTPHDPGEQTYAPTFQVEVAQIKHGFCPDCETFFRNDDPGRERC